jgi:hypothetical protein
MRVTFFCFAKRKSPKKRRPPVCDPCAVLRGKPASCRLRGAPWNSLCAARAARTATASQFTKHGRFDAHATPQPPRRRRSQQGVDSRTSKQPNNRTTEQPNNRTTEQPNNRTTEQPDSRTAGQPDSRTAGQPFGPLLRSAWPAQRVALAPARRGRAQRSEAMARVDVRFWVPFCACREAQGRGCVRVPTDTRTSCTDLPQLFERSA